MDDQAAINPIRDNGFGTYELVKGGTRLTNWVSREGKGGNSAGEWLFEATAKSVAAKKKAPTKKKATTKTTTDS
jgi:hypothetical protein